MDAGTIYGFTAGLNRIGWHAGGAVAWIHANSSKPHRGRTARDLKLNPARTPACIMQDMQVQTINSGRPDTLHERQVLLLYGHIDICAYRGIHYTVFITTPQDALPACRYKPPHASMPGYSCVPSMQGSLICRPAAMAAQTPDALLPGQKSDTAWIRQTRFVMTAGRAGFTRGAAFERALVCSHYPARDGKARLVRHLHARHARQLLVQHDVSAFEGDVGQAI